jgi:Potential Queuosine, Q, salvage protein family
MPVWKASLAWLYLSVTAVAILKRAQILVADVWACCGGRDLGEFSDIDELTAFADYRIPQSLLWLGVLEYSDELVKYLRNGKGYSLVVSLLQNSEYSRGRAKLEYQATKCVFFCLVVFTSSAWCCCKWLYYYYYYYYYYSFRHKSTMKRCVKGRNNYSNWRKQLYIIYEYDDERFLAVYTVCYPGVLSACGNIALHWFTARRDVGKRR